MGSRRIGVIKINDRAVSDPDSIKVVDGEMMPPSREHGVDVKEAPASCKYAMCSIWLPTCPSPGKTAPAVLYRTSTPSDP